MEGKLPREVFHITNNIISGSVYTPPPRTSKNATCWGTEVEFLLESVGEA